MLPRLRKRTVASYAGVALLSLFIGMAFASTPLSPVLSPGPHESYPFIDQVNVLVESPSGAVLSNITVHNLITNAGEDVISRQSGCGATSAPACANGGIYIAFTTLASPTASATDTTCFNAHEDTTDGGLTRALGTYSHTTGANTHKIANTFTYTGSTSVTVTGVCMFDASSTGNLFAETVLSPTATVNTNGDQIIVNWTFTH